MEYVLYHPYRIMTIEQFKNSCVFDMFVKPEKAIELRKQYDNKIYIYNNEAKRTIDTLLYAMEELRRTQRIFKKYATEEMKKYRTMPTLRKLRYNIKTYGKEEAMRLLKSAEYYVKGIAYPENVEWLISILNKISSESEYSSEWDKIISKIESMKGTTFTESMLKDINGGSGSILYMLEEHAISEQDAIIAIKRIIGLS